MVFASEQIGTDERMVADGDALLQASRRLDWRFLLPDPELGHVGYLGPKSGSLLSSLRLFSTSLTVIHRPLGFDRETGQYDALVAVKPSIEELRRVAGLVRPGGYLYLEAEGSRSLTCFWRLLARWLRLARLRMLDVADYVPFVRSLGFGEVQAHWHWPSFESCTMMIPLNQQAALLHVLARSERGGSSRLQRKLGHWLLRIGLISRLVPYFSVVARRAAR